MKTDRYNGTVHAGEDHYRALFEHAPMALWELDLAGVRAIVDELRRAGIVNIRAHLLSHPECVEQCARATKLLAMNQTALELHKATDKNDLWFHVQRISTPEALDLLGKEYACLAEGRLQCGADTVLKALTGDIVPVAVRWTVIPGCEATWSRVLVSVIDITARKRAEEERRKIEEQLQRTQKLASLEVLAGGVAHDFNNLLVAVLGNAELALNEGLPPGSVRDYLDGIVAAARRAAELCRQMLAYSGRGTPDMRPVDVNALVEDMTGLLRVAIPRKIAIKYALAAGLPAVTADTAQIRQVLMNLAANAVEAIGDRSGIIGIGTGAMDCSREYLREVWLDGGLAEGRYVYLEVNDTGSGMDRRILPRIFDPFFSTKSASRGLGLAAVLGIMRSHQGGIRVTSELDRGSAFRLLFPALAVPVPAPPPEPETAETWRGSGLFLLVDDEEALRAVVKRMLERVGFTVITAANGRDAVALFRQQAGKIAGVLLDLTMPHMDGIETLRVLRQLRPEVRVILSSGYNETDVATRLAGMDVDAFLQKPYSERTLIRTLRETLSDPVGGA
jgi:signal transduction histidine kinase/ActR/RegA family two-component response regulator